MNIFKNKYFLLGNLAFLLLAIPVALFFIKNQTSTRGSAAPTTTLSFISPSITTDQCDATKTTRLVVNPGENVVNVIQLSLKWDAAKFDIKFAPNTVAFKQTLKGPVIPPEGGSMTVTLSIGNIGGEEVVPITTTTDVGIITIEPKAATNGEFITLNIDTDGTKVYRATTQDNVEEGVNENVFNAGGSSPLQVKIDPKVCDGSAAPGAPTATPAATGATATPTPTRAVGAIPTLTPTATPTTAANQSPICINLTSSVSSGSAPLSVTFTATGRDTNGTISKATFNFGNGAQQDVTAGLGTASVSAQLAYTYTSGGSFTATTVFTDNNGAVSATCSLPIVVTGAFATLAPTATPTSVPMAPTTPPTATPTIADSGSLTTTVGIVGGILLIIFAGIFLLVL